MGGYKFESISVGFWQVHAPAPALFPRACVSCTCTGVPTVMCYAQCSKRSKVGMDWFCTGCAQSCTETHRQRRCPGQHAPSFHAASPTAPYVIAAGSTPQSNTQRRYARWRCASCDVETDMPETHVCAPKLQDDRSDGRDSAGAGSDCESDDQLEDSAYLDCEYAATESAVFDLHVRR
jgi:hypothetical protein